MNSDQLAVIRPALQEALAGGENSCVTFQLTDDHDRWVQFVGVELNCAYPHNALPSINSLPAALVSELGGVELVNWESGTFVTYGITAPMIDPLAKLIDSIFTTQLGCVPGEYQLDVAHEKL